MPGFSGSGEEPGTDRLLLVPASTLGTDRLSEDDFCVGWHR